MSYPASLDSFSTKVNAVDDVMAADVNNLQTAIVAVETELGTVVRGTATDLKTRLAKTLSGAGMLQFAAATTLTIATGSITPTQNWHRIDTEAAAATDDLDTITATAEAWVLFVRSVSGARNVVIKHGIGNIYCANGLDIILDNNFDLAILIYDATLAYWLAFGMSSAVLPNNGWINPGETWTYASATTFTISGDLTGKYAVGDKLKLTQTTVKYFYVIGISYGTPNTTITVAAGTDYTLANAAITANYYSKVVSPVGFPQYFTWNPYATSTPTSHGYSALPAGGVYRFALAGKTCIINVTELNTGTSNGNFILMDLPIIAVTITDMYLYATGRGMDNGTGVTNGCIARISSGASALNVYKGLDASIWTTSGGKSVNFVMAYEIP